MGKTKRTKDAPESEAGTYAFDKASGKIVKISDRIPGVSGRKRSASAGASEEAGPCGRMECGGGVCAGGGENI